MPRVRRWHRVSKEFNQDPQIRELRRNFADWMGYVWLEILKLADSGGGQIKGNLGELSDSLSYVAMTKRPSLAAKHITNALRFMDKLGWIVLQTDCVLVHNHLEYKKAGELLESRKGNHTKKRTYSITPSSNSLKGFEEFWEKYPQKEGKGKAEESWVKHTRGVEVGEILAGVDRWSGSQKWADGFVTMPATWLNQKRWKDNPRQAKSRSQAKLLWDQAQAEKEKV